MQPAQAEHKDIAEFPVFKYSSLSPVCLVGAGGAHLIHFVGKKTRMTYKILFKCTEKPVLLNQLMQRKPACAELQRTEVIMDKNSEVSV